MPFGETVAVYCENHTEQADTLCGQNAEFKCVKSGGTYSNHQVITTPAVTDNQYGTPCPIWFRFQEPTFV
jgi:hypothetical protein